MEIADMEAGFYLRERKALFIAQVQGSTCLPAPFDDF